jgi:CBS domain-containing protein
MSTESINACIPVDISDDDVYEAMRDIQGYLDITPSDFKDLYMKAYRHAMSRILSAKTVAEVMTREVISVRRDTSLGEVAQLLAAHGISGAPVVDEDKPVGVISERDFFSAMSDGRARNFMEVVAACLTGKECLAAPMGLSTASDLMSSPVVVARPEMTVVEASQLMTEHGVNRVPVVDAQGALIGIVSRADLVRA